MTKDTSSGISVEMQQSDWQKSVEFARLLRNEPLISMERIALEIAADFCPDLNVDSYLDIIDDFAERVRERQPEWDDLENCLGNINLVLFDELGFEGNVDDYYDPRNSFLNEVMDRRKGIPISLCVLYQAVARRIGIRVEGINFPSHFLLRAEVPGKIIFIDPFHKGLMLDLDGCEALLTQLTGQPVTLVDSALTPCSIKAMTARLLRNLKNLYWKRENYRESVCVLRRLNTLFPEDANERRDLGVALLHDGRPKQALNAFEDYLTSCPLAEDAHAVGAFVAAARRQISLLN